MLANHESEIANRLANSVVSSHIVPARSANARLLLHARGKCVLSVFSSLRTFAVPLANDSG